MVAAKAAPEKIADFVEDGQAEITWASTQQASTEGGKSGRSTPKVAESESGCVRRSVSVRGIRAGRSVSLEQCGAGGTGEGSCRGRKVRRDAHPSGWRFAASRCSMLS